MAAFFERGDHINSVKHWHAERCGNSSSPRGISLESHVAVHAEEHPQMRPSCCPQTRSLPACLFTFLFRTIRIRVCLPAITHLHLPNSRSSGYLELHGLGACPPLASQTGATRMLYSVFELPTMKCALRAQWCASVIVLACFAQAVLADEPAGPVKRARRILPQSNRRRRRTSNPLRPSRQPPKRCRQSISNSSAPPTERSDSAFKGSLGWMCCSGWPRARS